MAIVVTQAANRNAGLTEEAYLVRSKRRKATKPLHWNLALWCQFCTAWRWDSCS